MKEFIEAIRSGLDTGGELAEVLLNAVSLLFILLGAVRSLVRSLAWRRQAAGDHPLHTYFRRLFGGWLIVALEFQLAADVVGTIISPTTPHLIELGVVAVIRTFLNYFLNKELSEEREAPVAGREKRRDGKTEMLTAT